MNKIDKLYRRLSPGQQTRIDSLLLELESAPHFASSANEDAEERFADWPEEDEYLRAELEAARAEIERLQAESDPEALHIAYLHGQADRNQKLAAEQAKNVELRELVEHFALIDLGRSLLPDDFGLWVLRARKAIATPSDTSSLEDIVKKAGEVMRERCASESCRSHEYDATKAIRTLPAVTLEDLK